MAKSFQNKRALNQDVRKSLKSFDHNNSVFVMNEQAALKQSMNNPVLADSLDGDIEKIKNAFPKLRRSQNVNNSYSSNFAGSSIANVQVNDASLIYNNNVNIN